MMETAQVRNIELVQTATQRLISRTAGLPGLAVLYGPAGYGKTTAATVVANEMRGYFIQMRSAWTRKTLLEKILLEMSMRPSGTIPEMLDQVCAQLAASGRLLIIDEFDYCIRRAGLVELVRDIHEGADSSPILLLGEEMLPERLRRWERFHSRVLHWIPAQPVSVNDAAMLAEIYCPAIQVCDDLLTHLVKLSGGSLRRVSVNLANIKETAKYEGWSHVDLAQWGDCELYTGEAPRRG